MLPLELPEPLGHFIATFASLLDARHADLLEPLFMGTLLARGRRTATAWFRAGDFASEFRRGYTLLGTLGRRWLNGFASSLLSRLKCAIGPDRFWLFALDDTPTPRYGPCVEGAGIHHNPTPGPTHQRYVYGHVWVTLARVVRHPDCHTLALPLLADLYIRRADLPKIDADRRPAFHTKLDSAVEQIHWLAQRLDDADVPIWLAVDGGYSKQPVFQAARTAQVVLVGRVPCNAALYDVPPVVPAGQRGPGRPRKYGQHRLSLAKRAGHRQGWQDVQCFQYQQRVTKRIKTFLATWRPAGGVIRVVLVDEEDGWRAYCCTDPDARVVDILESVAGRTAIEQTFKEVKEVEGAGQQQLRYWVANAGAFNWCLWNYTAVEWWAWEQDAATLADRSDAPWDETERRVSHAEKRKALQQECLQAGFWRTWGDQPCPPKTQELIELLLTLAV
ncbi:MAG: transposase [Planctomycetia bacterium]|nr:transposase [Planctomycetia bacterium]